jgi:hypothetical protein
MLDLILGISDYSIKPDLHVHDSICKESRLLKIEALFALHQSLCCFCVTNRLHYNANSEKNAVAERGSCTCVCRDICCFHPSMFLFMEIKRRKQKFFFDKTMMKCLKFCK